MATRDDRKELAKTIARLGRAYIVTAVQGAGLDGGPLPYVHTLGLYQTRGWPELLMLGLHPKGAANLLDNLIATAQDRGITPEPGTMLRPQFLADLQIEVEMRLARVHPRWITDTLLGFHAVRYYGDPVPALQVQWPDEGGAYPGDTVPAVVHPFQPDLRQAPPPPGLFTPRGCG
jgi:hypothetical protein